MLSFTKKIFKSFDYSSVNYNFHINGKESFRTKFGGVLYIGYFIFFLYFSIKLSLDFIYKVNYSIIFIDKILTTGPEIDLKRYNLTFAFSIAYDNNTQVPQEIIEKYLVEKVYFVTMKNSSKKIKQEVKFKKCGLSDLYNIYTDSEYNYKEFLIYRCLNQTDFTLKGAFNDEIFQYLEYGVYINYTTYVNNSMSYISNFYTQNLVNVVLRYFDISIDVDNINQPIKTYENNIFDYINLSTVKKVNLDFSKYQFQNDDIILFGDPKTYEFLKLNTRQEYYYDMFLRNPSVTDYDNLLKYYIRSAPIVSIVKRGYQKLWDLLANIGGLVSQVLLFVVYLNTFYNKFKLKEELVNNLLKFKENYNLNQSKIENIDKLNDEYNFLSKKNNNNCDQKNYSFDNNNNNYNNSNRHNSKVLNQSCLFEYSRRSSLQENSEITKCTNFNLTDHSANFLTNIYKNKLSFETTTRDSRVKTPLNKNNKSSAPFIGKLSKYDNNILQIERNLVLQILNLEDKDKLKRKNIFILNKNFNNIGKTLFKRSLDPATKVQMFADKLFDVNSNYDSRLKEKASLELQANSMETVPSEGKVDMESKSMKINKNAFNTTINNTNNNFNNKSDKTENNFNYPMNQNIIYSFSKGLNQLLPHKKEQSSLHSIESSNNIDNELFRNNINFINKISAEKDEEEDCKSNCLQKLEDSLHNEDFEIKISPSKDFNRCNDNSYISNNKLLDKDKSYYHQYKKLDNLSSHREETDDILSSSKRYLQQKEAIAKAVEYQIQRIELEYLGGQRKLVHMKKNLKNHKAAVKPQMSKISNKKDISKESHICTTPRLKKKIYFDLNAFEIFCKVLCLFNKNRQEKYQLYKKSYKSINNQLNIFFYLKLIQDIEIMKSLLFTIEQIDILNFVAKPMIGKDVKTSNLNEIEVEEMFSQEQNVDNALDAYKNILNNKSFSEIDHKLIGMLKYEFQDVISANANFNNFK